MVSGKYAALTGAISREQAIANLSNNLANISTSGYKKSNISFESVLKEETQINAAKGINYDRIRSNFTDFSPGALRNTEDPLDMAIHGDGFFKVQGPNGILYTKRGDFQIDAEGQLTTSNGLPVLDDGNSPITIPDTDTSKIAVADEGVIYSMGPGGSRSEVAQLAVVEIEDRSKLRREADTTFSLEDGALENPSEESRVIQGSLELSNVNMAEGMAEMINNYRTFETYHKVLKSYQTISEQQEELGTLG
ncbi:MAG: flagellar basal-body rod protein FlgF [Desulfobulbaceae bacterium]|nr:flagellar basal-body rod protein FlgF [Desulfobulbaceae bacterium]